MVCREIRQLGKTRGEGSYMKQSLLDRVSNLFRSRQRENTPGPPPLDVVEVGGIVPPGKHRKFANDFSASTSGQRLCFEPGEPKKRQWFLDSRTYRRARKRRNEMAHASRKVNRAN